MGREELDNLVNIRRLKAEAASRKEFDGMLRSARTRLADAQNESLDPDSQFDLAYGAAHRLALAALQGSHGVGRNSERIPPFVHNQTMLRSTPALKRRRREPGRQVARKIGDT